MTEKNKEPTPTPQKSCVIKKGSLLFLGLIFLISTTAIVIAIYSKIQITQHRKALAMQLSHNDARSRLLQQQMVTLKTQISNNQQHINILQNEKNHVSVIVFRQQLLNILTMAQSQLDIGYHIANTIKLLQLASEYVKTSNIAKSASLHQAISNDLSSLQQLKSMTPSKIIEKLDNVSDAISQLAIKHKMSGDTSPQAEAPVKKSDNWWDKTKQSFISLKHLFIITHHAEPIKPLLLQSEAATLKSKIQLKIAEAEWAVINQQQDLYITNLKQATQFLNDYNVDPTTVDVIKHQLLNLSKTSLYPAHFTLQSLQLLQRMPSSQPLTGQQPS